MADDEYKQSIGIILEEYHTLRDEILSEQKARLQIISFTIGAYGVILTVMMNAIANSRVGDNNLQLIIFAGVTTLWALLIPSLMMSISTQQSIQRKGDYIREFIEANIPELRWETIWNNSKAKGLNRLGKVRSRGGLYIFMALLPAIFLVYQWFSFQLPQLWFLLPSILGVVALILGFEYQTYGLIIKGWGWNWHPDDWKYRRFFKSPDCIIFRPWPDYPIPGLLKLSLEWIRGHILMQPLRWIRQKLSKKSP